VANDRINVWLKMRDVARFVRDAKIAEHSIKEMGDAADNSGNSFGALGSALGSLGDVLPKARTETGILGLTLGSIVTILTLGMPLILAFAGATTALAGSMAGAALGAGALAVGLGGVALAAGPLALVAADLFKGFTKVNAAFSQWQKSVSMYGRNSNQAETALSRLNAVAGQFGGPTLITLVKQWNDFMSAFRKANAPAIQTLIKIFSLFLSTATALLPVFSQVADMVANSLLGAFTQLADFLKSAGFVAFLQTMASVFQSLAGPMMQIFINLLQAMMNIAVAVAPALQWLVNEMLSFSQAIESWSSGGGVGAVIAQFQSWWNLIKAVGGLLITILSAGASQGKSLVDQLTAIVNRWNAWLNTAKGQKSMQDFFRDSISIFKTMVHFIALVVGALFDLGRALMPIYIVAFRALADGWHQVMDALKPAQPFFRNVLLPLLKGIAKGGIMAVVGAFKFLILVIKILAPILGFLGKILSPFKGVIEAIGVVLGFVFGGEIVAAIKVLGELIGFLKPLAYLFRLIGVPIKAAGVIFEWFGAKVLGVLAKIGSKFGWLRGAIMDVVSWLTGAGKWFYDAGVKLWNKLRAGIIRAIAQGIGFAADIGKAVYNFVARLINKGIPNHLGPIDLPNNPIPMLAMGGVVTGTGSWITGDAGPEINTLRNGRVTVVPLSPAVKAQSTSATMAPSEKRVVVAKVYLKGKQIAEAVADDAEDEAARK